MSPDSAFSKKEISIIAVLAVLAMALTTVAVVPNLRASVKSLLGSQHRTIIAKTTGKLSTQGPQVLVLKIKAQDQLLLEVYALDETGNRTLMAKIPLAEKRDGYFSINGNATNLGLADVDHDGQLEIVAPTYDEQMVPRLNIFKYNPDSKGFDRVNAPSGTEL